MNRLRAGQHTHTLTVRDERQGQRLCTEWLHTPYSPQAQLKATHLS